MKITTKKNSEKRKETITVTTSNGTVITIDDYKENGYNSVKITDPKCDDRIYGDKIHTIYVDTTPNSGIFDGSIHTSSKLTSKSIKREKVSRKNHTWTSLTLNDGFSMSVHHSIPKK